MENMKRFSGLLLSALLLTGCANATKDEGINAVATTTQICDYLTQIASHGMKLVKTDAAGHETTSGDGNVTFNLTCLLAPNASAHEHEMTPKQMKALAHADLFFINGVDLEHFLDSAVQSSGFKGQTITTSDNVQLRPWPFVTPGEEPEFTYDPHIWTDPKRAAIQVRNIGAALEKFAPQATDEYEKQLADLDHWARESINSVPEENRVLFTSHDAFGYFADSYGIKFIGAALSDFNHQQDATADHINKAAEAVKASGAKALFAENSNNSKSIEAIARAAGVKAITNDDALYGDSLGPNVTYIQSIIHNVTTLVTAWDGTPAELPDSLK